MFLLVFAARQSWRSSSRGASPAGDQSTMR
jgi:hypothetical protein